MEQEKTEKPEDTDYDQNPIYLPRQQGLRGWWDAPGYALIAAKRGRQKVNYYHFTTLGEIKGRK